MRRRTANLSSFLLSLFVTAVLLSKATIATPVPTRTLDHAAIVAPRRIVEPSNLPQGNDETVVCVFPISGQYGLLPRLLYYVSLIFAIVCRRQRWLVLGALASTLSYAGSASIHMMALVGSKKPIFDLDILAVWAVLTTGCLAFAALVHWSSSIKQSNARVVLLLWGVLVAVGCLFGRSLLQDVESTAEPACRSPTTGALLTSKYELLDPQFNCTYKCFDAKTPMRHVSEIVAIPTERLSGKFSEFIYVLMAPVLAAAHKSLSAGLHPHSPSEQCRWLVMGYLDNSLNARLSQHVYDTACSTWYGGYFLLLNYARRAKFQSSLKRRVGALLICPLVVLELLLDLATPPIFVANIIFNELNLMKNDLPTEEGMTYVGQWSPIVSAILVVIASIINRSMKWYSDWRARNKEAQTDLEQAPNDNTWTICQIHAVMSFFKDRIVKKLFG